MVRFFNKILKCEDGAVTVDWVVLTAALVGLAVAGATTTADGVNVAASTIQTSVATKTVDNGD